MGKALVVGLRFTVTTVVSENEADAFVDLTADLLEALRARGLQCSACLEGKEVAEEPTAKALDPNLN